MFHGAPTAGIKRILTEGFDVRVSNTAGMCGAGAYFADMSGCVRREQRTENRVEENAREKEKKRRRWTCAVLERW